MEWNKLIKEKKYYVPAALIVLLIIGIILNGFRLKDISKDVIEIDIENYAYKDITGYHSPYLISSNPNAFLIDILVDLEDSDSAAIEEALLESGYDGDELGQPMKESERGMLYQTDEHNGILDIGNGLFDFALITDELWDSEKAIAKNADYAPIQDLAQNLKENAENLIEGTFNWNYKNSDNKDAFLAYRVGNYIYDSRIVSTDLLYKRIQEKVVANKIRIEVEYNVADVKTYIHPSIGGTTLETPIILHIQEGNEKSSYRMDYISQLSFRTPSPRDLWTMWAPADENLRMVNVDYLRNIEKIN